MTPATHPLEHIPASFPVGRRWYVFATEPSREKVAHASISDLGLPVFIPFEKRVRLVRRRRVTVEYALFTGYGFVQFDINLDAWGALVGAKGVLDVLRMSGVPVAVPDRIVDGLRVADAAGVFDRTAPPKVGMSVEITEGPFSSLIGKIKRARTAEKMDVLLDFLGAEVMTTVPLVSLREINTTA